MPNHVVIPGLSVLAGFVAQAQVGGDTDLIARLIEKGGLSMLAAAIVYWMLTSFTRLLNKLTDAIDAQTKAINEEREEFANLRAELGGRPCMKNVGKDGGS